MIAADRIARTLEALRLFDAVERHGNAVAAVAHHVWRLDVTRAPKAAGRILVARASLADGTGWAGMGLDEGWDPDRMGDPTAWLAEYARATDATARRLAAGRVCREPAGPDIHVLPLAGGMAAVWGPGMEAATVGPDGHGLPDARRIAALARPIAGHDGGRGRTPMGYPWGDMDYPTIERFEGAAGRDLAAGYYSELERAARELAERDRRRAETRPLTLNITVNDAAADTAALARDAAAAALEELAADADPDHGDDPEAVGAAFARALAARLDPGEIGRFMQDLFAALEDGVIGDADRRRNAPDDAADDGRRAAADACRRWAASLAAPEHVSPADAYTDGWLDGLKAATDTTKGMA
ncbi:hypothetical protein EMO91_06830 [Bifidobacterium myosotis]|uniref:Uncharacterized protein n=2 Tax=Bifidobacterium myosotis TaxID=1630166 RepID=A0A5M9ZL36_9BIFI|nr:hypothetical protein EMO91_06830 [Bifidobacterium myosotis]